MIDFAGYCWIYGRRLLWRIGRRTGCCAGPIHVDEQHDQAPVEGL